MSELLTAPVQPGRSRQEVWFFGVLVLLPLLAYARLASAGFVWDDDSMLTANPLIRASDGLWKIWFTTSATDYWPVTYSSFWVEWRIWGLWAPGYHLTNLVLHVVEGLLLWRLLLRLKIPGAFFAALWFSLHPINVESVAWIAQRKNLLAMLFFLASIWLFVKAETLSPTPIRRSSPIEGGPRIGGGINLFHGLSLFAFILAMLSKGSTAPLPLVLLGLVLWHRRLRWKDGLWICGFLLTAFALVIVNIWFSHKSGGAVIRDIGLSGRIAGAGGAIWFYLGKILWPVGLCFVYPHWTVPPVNPIWWLGLGLAFALTIVLWLGRNRGAKPEFAAWLYFGAMLLPVLGLVDVYFMRYSLVADHYVHLALVGVVVWAAALFAQFQWPQSIAWAIALTLGLLTFQQTAIYRDDFILFHSVLARNPDCWMAHGNLGKTLLTMPGQLVEAIGEFEEAVRLNPDYADSHNDLGIALSNLPSRVNDAIAQYEEALRLKPDYPEAHNNLALLLADQPGRKADAIAHYETALRLNSDYAAAHYNLANVLASEPERLADAIDHYKTALRFDPNIAEIHLQLALALLKTPGHSDEAREHLETVLRLEPGNDSARQILSGIRAPQQ